MSPRNQERRFDPEYAATLLSIARQDFSTARYAQSGVASGDVRSENVFFLYQQAVEKLLKAVLCHLELPVPLVHDLGVLPANLPPETQPGIGYEFSMLNEFAGVRQYEEGSLIYEAEDLEDARSLAEELLRWGTSVRSNSVWRYRPTARDR